MNLQGIKKEELEHLLLRINKRVASLDVDCAGSNNDNCLKGYADGIYTERAIILSYFYELLKSKKI